VALNDTNRWAQVARDQSGTDWPRSGEPQRHDVASLVGAATCSGVRTARLRAARQGARSRRRRRRAADLVEVTDRREDVDDDVAVVEQHPAAAHALGATWRTARRHLHGLLDLVDQRPHETPVRRVERDEQVGDGEDRRRRRARRCRGPASSAARAAVVATASASASITARCPSVVPVVVLGGVVSWVPRRRSPAAAKPVPRLATTSTPTIGPGRTDDRVPNDFACSAALTTDRSDTARSDGAPAGAPDVDADTTLPPMERIVAIAW
jgi:hypothetical protein